MEFTVNQSDLTRELSLSQGVVEKKTTIPILSNVLLEAVGEPLATGAEENGARAAIGDVSLLDGDDGRIRDGYFTRRRCGGRLFRACVLSGARGGRGEFVRRFETIEWRRCGHDAPCVESRNETRHLRPRETLERASAQGPAACFSGTGKLRLE